MRLFATALIGVALLAQVRTVLPTATSTPAQEVALSGEPLAVLNAEKAWLGAEAFWPLARLNDPIVQRYAIRALGRLEDPANVPPLIALAETRTPSDSPSAILTRRAFVADAVAQSLYRFDPDARPEAHRRRRRLVPSDRRSRRAERPASSLRLAASPTGPKTSSMPRSAGCCGFGSGSSRIVARKNSHIRRSPPSSLSCA